MFCCVCKTFIASVHDSQILDSVSRAKFAFDIECYIPQTICSCSLPSKNSQ